MQDFREFERRRTERQPLDAEGRLVEDDTSLRVVNLSARGLETESASRLMVGSQHEVVLSWQGADHHVHGTVVWSRLDRTVLTRSGDLTPVYRSGLEAASASIPVLERLVARRPTTPLA